MYTVINKIHKANGIKGVVYLTQLYLANSHNMYTLMALTNSHNMLALQPYTVIHPPLPNKQLKTHIIKTFHVYCINDISKISIKF